MDNHAGCELYGMGVGFFGLVSILTFSAIACERCLVIACPSRPAIGFADGRWKVTRAQAKKVIKSTTFPILSDPSWNIKRPLVMECHLRLM